MAHHASRAYISTVTRLSYPLRRFNRPYSNLRKYQNALVTKQPAPCSHYNKKTWALPWIRTQTQIQQRQPFSSSASFSKKKDKAKRNDEIDSSSIASTGLEATDPFDFSKLHKGIADAIGRLKEDLQKLRLGGRFNPEVIEQLRVNLVKGSNETVRLGEVAQVVPKGGRAVAIIVGEEDLLKSVNSAIISSNLSLTPQPDQHNILQLNVPIPPPTKESREQAVKAAKGAMEKASSSVRSSRAAIHKKLQDMQKKKEARPDDVRKAHDQMEKVVEKAQKDIKDTFEIARKAMEQV